MMKTNIGWRQFTRRFSRYLSKQTYGLALVALMLALLAQPIWRALAAAGDLDTTFGNNGTVQLSLDMAGIPHLAIQHDGKILAISANTVNPVTDDFKLVRLNLNGYPDTTFGDNGSVTTDFGGNGEKSADLAIQFN